MNRVSLLQRPQVAESTFILPAEDGYPLAATEFSRGDRRGPTVLVAPDIGLSRHFYREFATFLAQRGFTVITWDWRGTGDSRRPEPSSNAAQLQDWGRLDLSGAIAWGRRCSQGAALAVAAHGVGGQLLGLAPNADELTAVVTIAAPVGYWGYYARPLKYLGAMFWYGAVPLLLRLCGRLPGRLLGLREDVPAEVARQWAQWSRCRGYLGDYRGHRRITGPMLAFSFEDDVQAPRRAVDALHREYRSRELVRRHLLPVDLGVGRIGHRGFFEQSLAPRLWPETAAWLTQRLSVRQYWRAVG